MPAFTVTVQDAEVQADLKALAARVDNIAPAFQTLGEGIIERTKRRFDTSSAPDGTPLEAQQRRHPGHAERPPGRQE